MSGSAITPLIRLDALGREYGLSHLYAKCEGANPTATHKDRTAARLALAALASGAAGVAVGTCGNLGVALARASRLCRLPCTTLVPRPYRAARIKEMQAFGAEVVRAGETYEAAVALSQSLARERGYFDANPVGRAGEIAIAAYGAIVNELLAQCPVAIGSIWLPVGNGTCAAGLHARLRDLALSVRIGVVGSAANTSLTASLATGRLVELEAGALNETAVNEPLVNWSSLHAREGIAAVRASDGLFYAATDAELVAARDRLEAEAGLAGPPAGAAGAVGLRNFATRLDAGAAHIILLSA